MNAGTWSEWRREGRDGRRRRYIDVDGSRYTQRDHASAPILNSDGQPITPAVAQALGISRTSTPRTPAVRPPPTQTDQINPENVGPSRDYEIVTRRRQPSTGTRVRSIPEDNDANVHDDEDDTDPQDEDDDVDAHHGGGHDSGTRPDTSPDPEKARQTSTGTDLQSVPSARSKSSLPAGYAVKQSSVFVPGTVLRVPWAESKGTTAKGYQGDGEVHKTLRPMIVVSQKTAHCVCAPIFSYGKQGVGKPGLKGSEVEHHAVVHMEDKLASLTSAERGKWSAKISVEDAITVKPVLRPNSKPYTLSASSRVRFDAPNTVRHNLKVLIIGHVIEDHLSRLQDRWREAFWPNSA